MSAAGASARPSPGYILTSSIACLGIAFLGVSIGAGVLARAGIDPVRALDVDGMATFLLAFAVLFLTRVMFWSAAPPGLRAFVRLAVSAVFGVGIVAAGCSVAIAASVALAGGKAGMAAWFTALACGCQAGSLAWLVRYRAEGL